MPEQITVQQANELVGQLQAIQINGRPLFKDVRIQQEDVAGAEHTHFLQIEYGEIVIPIVVRETQGEIASTGR